MTNTVTVHTQADLDTALADDTVTDVVIESTDGEWLTVGSMTTRSSPVAEPTLDTARLAEVTKLDEGPHESPEEGWCLMEAVAYVGGLDHTDDPVCVSPALRGIGRLINDNLSDERRQDLIPLIPHLLCTGKDGHDAARRHLVLDWLIRAWLTAWLDLVPASRDAAAKIRRLDRIADPATVRLATPLVCAARDIARDVARDVARGRPLGHRPSRRPGRRPICVARTTAWDAAQSAAWDAAQPAAWDAARAAAWDAARAAAWEAARTAAWGAAQGAWDAAQGAGDAARTAAWGAAQGALAPTAARLQGSSVDLYRRMVLIGEEDSP